MQKTLSIGRDASNYIILNDIVVSRKHAQLIISDGGQVLIKDLGSSNGTFVNGNRITEFYLKPDDVVKCASVYLNWQHYVNLAVSNQNEPNTPIPPIDSKNPVIEPTIRDQSQPEKPRTIIVKGEKSMGIAILLTFLFGPLGMLYSTVTGGIVMMFLGGFILLITFGFGALLIWPICIIWAAIATNQYNNKLTNI